MASQPHGLGSCQAAVGVCTHPSTIVGLTCMKQSLSPLGHLHLRSPDRHTACLPSPKQGSYRQEPGAASRDPCPLCGRNLEQEPGHWEQGGDITGRSSACGWLRAQGKPWAQTPGGATAACRAGRGRCWAGILEGNLTGAGGLWGKGSLSAAASPPPHHVSGSKSSSFLL